MTYSEDELNIIKDKIEGFSKENQIEILKILNNHVNLNENNNGVFVNLTSLEDPVVHELENYIHFVESQEKVLKYDETKKENIEETYFKKDNKEKLQI